MNHPFDRYEKFTDLTELKAASQRSLRKCVRVNTLKMSVEDFKNEARAQKWELQSVPWCKEGFFIDREDRSSALGKNLHHLLGYFYMQEASSMLPVTLLDPQPGEKVLDMAAAPGSKTTQMSALMNGNGIIVANDMQEARLQTLKAALQRLACPNVNICKHMGQWYGKYMTESFDRVLCDAPCTAQGTSRKDKNALSFSSEHGIGKAAKLQRELLISAIDACKVGGRIVYSTCTLTPEENEDVIFSILSKLKGKIKVIDPTAEQGWNAEPAKENSDIIQSSLYPGQTAPMFRLWPHTYDTEGFFCAVLEKIEPTCEKEWHEWVLPNEKPLGKNDQKVIRKILQETYGTDFLSDQEVIAQGRDDFRICNASVLEFGIPSKNYSTGLSFYKGLKSKYEFRINSDLAEARGLMATENVIEVSDEQLSDVLAGRDLDCDEGVQGDVIIRHKNLSLGLGLAKGGIVKNRLSRSLILQQPTY